MCRTLLSITLHCAVDGRNPNKHATAHWRESGHPIIRSFEPGEEWFWDYGTDDYVDGPVLAAPLAHPATQSAPGPADRLPPDWRSKLGG